MQRCEGHLVSYCHELFLTLFVSIRSSFQSILSFFGLILFLICSFYFLSVLSLDLLSFS